MLKYDVIIIGAGQAGVPLAKKMALAGKKTLLVEKRWIGGTCVNDGCTPTKAWVASAKAAYNAANSGLLGIKIKGYSVNLAKIKNRKDDIVIRFREGSLKGLEATKNLTVLFGEATFTGPKEISVIMKNGKKKAFAADLIFINTGAKTRIPDIDGLDTINYLTSTTILDLEHIPKHLLIIGGNYIGLEFAQMFRRFGSRVTVLEKSERIVLREDEDISEELTQILTDEDVNIRPNTVATAFKKKSGGKISVSLLVGEDEKKIRCTHVLIAVGRTPQTAALNLDKTGVETDEHGAIKVNDFLETTMPGIYALGDVKGGPAFTHISYNDYAIVYRNLIEKQNLSIKDRPVPYCMFTDPQLGHIGLNETEAKKLQLNYKVAKMPMSHVARAIENGDTRGIMKAIVDADTKKILGATILGAEGGEIMTILQMAMAGGITYEQIRWFVFAHPLYAESLNNLFMRL